MRLLTIDQAAEIMAAHPVTIRRLVDAHMLDAVDLHHGTGKKRSLRITDDTIARYIRQGAIAQAREKAKAKDWIIERRREGA